MILKEVPDQKLTSLVKEERDNEALKELIARHSGIYINMLKTYGGKSLNQNQINDFLNLKDSVIYEAALDYDPEKAKFSTFLANKTKFMCLSEKTRFQKNSNTVNLEDIVFCQKDPSLSPDEECLQKEKMKKIIDMILEHNDERVRHIFYQRYFCGKNKKLMPWKKIGKKIGLSAQSCINIHDRTLAFFKNKIKNEQTIEF